MARKKQQAGKRPPTGPEPVLPGVNPAVPDTGDTQPALPFVVVCAGASAGGLPALTGLLGATPADTGMAIVVVQHLEPSHASRLTEILQRETHLPVREVTEGMRIEPDHVYVIPPGKNLVMDGPLLQLAPRTEIRGAHRPVDHFMRSLAEAQADHAIGVVLSGTGSDGTQGLQEIKAAGGITFAQDDTAEHGGMPRSAIAAGCVDLVLAPARIGEELSRISQHPYVRPVRPVRPGEAEQPAPPPADPDSPEITRALELLRRTAGVDFANYKRNTLHRRLARRMVLHRLEHLGEYVRRLEDDPAEVEALYQDILINVTSFFRDPAAFDALKTTVFPRLTGQKSRHEPVRVWALGCSTGEEAYSIAMAYTEYCDSAGVRVPMQVFATDLNASGIEKARAGIYPRGIAQDLSPERLARFFVEIDGSYRIAKPIRDMCVFARQNALADPPFSHMGLVACRNMLIYLEPVLQQKLMPLLHYALQPSGFLWLGNSETVGTFRELFELEDPQHKIYVRKPGPGLARLPVTLTPRLHGAPAFNGAAPAPARPRPDDPQREADRLLLARYSPAGVLVDADLNVLQFRGDTGPYLAPAPGRPSLDLLKMLREGLLAPLRSAVRKAQNSEAPVREEGLRVRVDGGYRNVNLVVLPLKGTGIAEGSMLVLFEEPARQAESRARHAEASFRAAMKQRDDSERDPEAVGVEVARLQLELHDMREYLQTVTEEYETATEELQSANEEVQSANEELQSANEELETSREEIQSSNEELTTVNDELQRRNDELQRANNDLVNLIASVQMPIVMLAPDLRIRRFTPAAEKVLNLIPADGGRPLGDIRLKVPIPDLEALVLDVIETVSARELDVQDAEGRWFLVRIRPYRTLENRIDGAVLTLVDIDTIKRAEQDLRESDRRKDDFLAMLSHELRTPLAALRSAAEVLNEPGAPAPAQDTARAVMARQTRNMARMVDDLLDLARISHGTIQLKPAPTDVLAAVRHAVDATQSGRATAAQEIALSLPTRPLHVMADVVRFDQILVNLLNNASKFTPREGQISVTVQAEPAAPETAPHGRAAIRVRDNGAGIDPQVLPRVFTMFRDMRRAPQDEREGLGLGLTLAHTLVELHGGTIEAHSDGAGRGSEFVVRLPLLRAAEQVAAAPATSPPVTAGPPRRILVVDDNVDAARILCVLLELDGHTVAIAHDGRGAIATAKTFRPDVVLLDLGMPGMDGYAVAPKLREEAGLEDVTIVAVTGYARDQDVRRTREAGFDRHLTKPVERRTLQALFAGLA